MPIEILLGTLAVLIMGMMLFTSNKHAATKSRIAIRVEKQPENAQLHAILHNNKLRD